MTTSIDKARVHAEAAFKTVTPGQRMDAISEYKATLEAVRLRMAQQKAARLAKEAKSLSRGR
jgi:hypothetical protein